MRGSKPHAPVLCPASISPVLLGCALAYYEGIFDIRPAILCFLVALFAQIASNFANDYFDFKKGADGENRLGPERAVAQGWITPRAMLIGTFITLGLACLSGLLLLPFADWRLLFVGCGHCYRRHGLFRRPFPIGIQRTGRRLRASFLRDCSALFYLLHTDAALLPALLSALRRHRFAFGEHLGGQ